MTEERGLIHLYWGEGKGKTTAAMGLALRGLAAGRRVVIVQFLKGGASGEIPLLESLGAKVLRGKAGSRFSFQMDERERADTRALQTEHLRQALELDGDLLVLDEACAAWETDLVDRELLRKAVLEKRAGQELALTGVRRTGWGRRRTTAPRCAATATPFTGASPPGRAWSFERESIKIRRGDGCPNAGFFLAARPCSPCWSTMAGEALNVKAYFYGP